jgi:hypothetical protein
LEKPNPYCTSHHDYKIPIECHIATRAANRSAWRPGGAPTLILNNLHFLLEIKVLQMFCSRAEQCGEARTTIRMLERKLAKVAVL